MGPVSTMISNYVLGTDAYFSNVLVAAFWLATVNVSASNPHTQPATHSSTESVPTPIPRLLPSSHSCWYSIQVVLTRGVLVSPGHLHPEQQGRPLHPCLQGQSESLPSTSWHTDVLLASHHVTHPTSICKHTLLMSLSCFQRCNNPCYITITHSFHHSFHCFC